MKFLFTSNPLYGHYLPMVPLIRATRAAGHEVRVATGSDLTGMVRHHGFPLWLVGSTFAEAMASMPAGSSIGRRAISSGCGPAPSPCSASRGWLGPGS